MPNVMTLYALINQPLMPDRDEKHTAQFPSCGRALQLLVAGAVSRGARRVGLGDRVRLQRRRSRRVCAAQVAPEVLPPPARVGGGLAGRTLPVQ